VTLIKSTKKHWVVRRLKNLKNKNTMEISTGDDQEKNNIYVQKNNFFEDQKRKKRKINLKAKSNI
jgi:hypothetical protein